MGVDLPDYTRLPLLSQIAAFRDLLGYFPSSPRIERDRFFLTADLLFLFGAFLAAAVVLEELCLGLGLLAHVAFLHFDFHQTSEIFGFSSSSSILNFSGVSLR